MSCVIGIDSSTQSCTVEVRDSESGVLLDTASAPLPQTHPPKSEQWPKDWWAGLLQVFSQLDLHDVVGVSVTGQSHGLVLLNKNGSVLRPAKLWNDTESQGEADELVARLGAERWIELSGSLPKAAFTITKLAWVWKNEPDIARQVAHLLLPHDWLTFRLSNSMVTDRGEASTTGYFNPGEGAWSLPLLELVDGTPSWGDFLPEIVAPDSPAGELSSGPAEVLGLRRGIKIGAGTGDQMAGALGLGLHPGEFAISLGTSGTVYTVHDRPVADKDGIVDGYADATGRYLPLVCTLNAAKVVDATRRILGVDYDEFNELLVGGEALGDLTLVPYLDGERSPNLPFSSGYLTGIRSDVTRSQFARAAVEGILCGILEGLDALLRATGQPKPGYVLVTGGASRSSSILRVLADLSQVPVYATRENETSARGACVQAAAIANGKTVQEVASAWKPEMFLAAEPSAPAEYSDRRRSLFRKHSRFAPDLTNRA